MLRVSGFLAIGLISSATSGCMVVDHILPQPPAVIDPTVIAPRPKFHPVPTRPVFSPAPIEELTAGNPHLAAPTLDAVASPQEMDAATVPHNKPVERAADELHTSVHAPGQKNATTSVVKSTARSSGKLERVVSQSSGTSSVSLGKASTQSPSTIRFSED